MDAQSQRRISALVEVASTAQSLERHDMPSRQYTSEEIQSHPSSIETSTSRRGRDQDNGGGGKEEEDVDAEATRLGVNGGALLEHQTRAMHNYLLQIMAQVPRLHSVLTRLDYPLPVNFCVRVRVRVRVCV